MDVCGVCVCVSEGQIDISGVPGRSGLPRWGALAMAVVPHASSALA